MKTLDEMIAVMEASKTKKIQVFSMRDNDLGPPCWHDVGDAWKPTWNWERYDYRVKPDTKEPQRLVGFRRDGEIVHAAYPDIRHAALAHDGFLDERDLKVEFIELTPEVKEKLGL